MKQSLPVLAFTVLPALFWLLTGDPHVVLSSCGGSTSATCTCTPAKCVAWEGGDGATAWEGYQHHSCSTPERTCSEDPSQSRARPELQAIWEAVFTGILDPCDNPTQPAPSPTDPEGDGSCDFSRCVGLGGCSVPTPNVAVTFTPKITWELDGFSATCCPDNDDGSAEISIYAYASIQCGESPESWDKSSDIGDGWWKTTVNISKNGACGSQADATSGTFQGAAATATCPCNFVLQCGESQTETRQVKQEVKYRVKFNLVAAGSGEYMQWNENSAVEMKLAEDPTKCELSMEL